MPSAETHELLLLRSFFDPLTLPVAAAVVTPEQMLDEGRRLVAEAVCDMARKGLPINPETASLHLQADFDDLPESADARIAAIMAEEPPTPELLSALSRRVSVESDRAARRALGEWLIGDGARVLCDDALARIDEYVRSSAAVRPDEFENGLDGIRAFLGRRDRPEPYRVGMGRMDDIYKIHRHSYNVILADSGVGKTAAMMNMVINLARQRVRVYVFSIEMDKDSLYSRIMGILSGVAAYRLESPDITGAEKEQADHAFQQNLDLLSFVELATPADTSASSIYAMIVKAISKKGPGVVFIDYLSLLTASARHINNETSMQAQVSKTLMLAAKTTGTPIIALSQVTANNSGMELIKGSKQPKNDAWTILLLERDDENDQGEQVILTARILKNRKGPSKRKFNLVYNLPTQRIFYSDEVQ